MRNSIPAKKFSRSVIGLSMLLCSAILLPSTATAIPISEAPADNFAAPEVNIIEEESLPDMTSEVVVPASVVISTPVNLPSADNLIFLSHPDLQPQKTKSSVAALFKTWMENSKSSTLNLQSNQQAALAIALPAPTANSCTRNIPMQKDYLDKLPVCTVSSIY